jgi:hypothetical protein
MIRTALLLLIPLAVRPAWPQAATLSPEPPGLEDTELRKEAVRLLERAVQVSTPARWLTHDQTLRFRVTAPAAGEANDGEVRSYFGANRLYRSEVTYGDYRLVDVSADGRRGWLATPGPRPPIVDRIRKFTPVYLVQFDNQDIIRRIHNATVSGRGARCIDFVTVFGEQRQQNQVCVDAATGAMVSFSQGAVTLVQSEFFECSGALFPGRIARMVDGVQEFEIEQKISVVKEFPAGTFEFPPGATMGSGCRQFRRAFAKDTPQPPPGSSPEVIDIVLRGYIGTDGRVFQLSPYESSRPDLNERAIKLVSTWTYEPARCDGNAVTWLGTFHVQFKGY